MNSIRDCSENTQVLLSGIINREDGNYIDKISEINTKMASYREGQGRIFINNNNIDGTCLNRGRLHLNKKGYSKFSLNLIQSMKSMSLHVMHAAQLIESSSNISLRKYAYKALKRVHNENPSNVIFSFLNINSIRYKFENLKFFCMNNVDILLIGETKLDSSFPDA